MAGMLIPWWSFTCTWARLCVCAEQALCGSTGNGSVATAAVGLHSRGMWSGAQSDLEWLVEG